LGDLQARAALWSSGGGARVIGQQIGHYRLEDKLGRGGFGTVYQAVHAQLPSLRVAVKVVHPNLASDQGFQRLLEKEVEVLHGLQHPGIVAFRDLLVEPAGTAIVLELLEGLDLRHALQQGPFTPGEVARILLELLEALGYAHRRGVVHRDIKPENIFLCSDGRLKLMDFGIAKVAHNTLASQSGMVSGTLDYMAPERFRHESPPSSDLYSLGLVSWELLTGRLACPDGDIPAKIGWHMGQGAPDLRELLPDAPAWLSELVGRLCATDPQERPIDAEAALTLLEELWPSPGPRASSSVRPRERRGRPAREPLGARRGPSSPTLAPGLAGTDGDLSLAQKSTPTWTPMDGATSAQAGRPPAGVSDYREPRPEPSSPASRTSLLGRVLPRGAALMAWVAALLAMVGTGLLALAVGSSAEPGEQLGTGLGLISIMSGPAGSFLFFLAALVESRPLARALSFSLSALAILSTGLLMPVAMMADGNDVASSVTGGVCCGGLPMLLPAVLAVVFFARGLGEPKRERRA
jgi:serine/threonine protein kinase